MQKLHDNFIVRIKKIYPNIWQKVIDSFSVERIGSFRINYLKSNEKEVLDEFFSKNIKIQKIFPNHNIWIFDKKYEYQIKWSNSFYGWKIYLQSISSMLPVFCLDVIGHEKILDVCSAPWWKTTQISTIINNSWKIFAIEQNKIRFDKLKYNCNLQWATNVECIKNDARKFLQNVDIFFDKILIDAPCSAEGRIYLPNEKTFGFWSEENIYKKSQLQSELLDLSWSKLKKWWTLVYSTCTISPEENEELISNFIKNNNNAEILPIDIGLSDCDFWIQNIDNFDWKNFDNLKNMAVRILPTRLTEWFFIAKIRKK